MQAGLATLWQDGAITLGTEPRQAPGAPGGPVILRPATDPASPQADAYVTGAVSLEDLKRIAAEATNALSSTGAVEGWTGVPQPIPGREWHEYCLSVIDHLARKLFPLDRGGITLPDRATRDDGMVGTGQNARRDLGVPSALWAPVTSWQDQIAQVEEAGAGAAAFVRIGWPNRIGHAIAVVHTRDQGLAVIDPDQQGHHRIHGLSDPGAFDPGPLLHARALTIDATGQVIAPPATDPDATAAARTADALTDPTYTRIGKKKPIQPQDPQKLRDALDRAGAAGLSTRQITQEVFSSNRSGEDIQTLLGQLDFQIYETWDQRTSGRTGRYYRRATDNYGVAYPPLPSAENLRPVGSRPARSSNHITSQDVEDLQRAVDQTGETGVSRSDLTRTLFHRRIDDLDQIIEELLKLFPGVYRTWEQLSGNTWALRISRVIDPRTQKAYPPPGSSGARVRNVRGAGVPADPEPSWNPAIPVSSYSSLAGAVRTDWGPQERWAPVSQFMADRGLQFVPVRADGDCFFNALIATARPERLAGMSQPEWIRQHLASRLLNNEDLRHDVEPSVRWFLAEDRADARLENERSEITGHYRLGGMNQDQINSQARAWHIQQMALSLNLDRRSETDGEIERRYRNQLIAAHTRPVSQSDWQRIAQDIRTPQSWDNVAGDIVPQLAARVFDLSIVRISPETDPPGRPYAIGSGTHSIVMVRSGDSHWDATARAWVTQTADPGPGNSIASTGSRRGAGPSGSGRSGYGGPSYSPYSRPRGGLRVDDPLALGWPVGHEIALDNAGRGSDEDQRRRAPEDRRPAPVLDEVQLAVVSATTHSGSAADGTRYTFERGFPGRHGGGDRSSAPDGASFSYLVTSAGRIVLPDGLELPATGWVRHGPDFLHTAHGVVLLGDSGWIGRVQNWHPLSEALATETLPPYRVHTDSTTFYLTPANGPGPSVRIGPLTGGTPTAGVTEDEHQGGVGLPGPTWVELAAIVERAVQAAGFAVAATEQPQGAPADALLTQYCLTAVEHLARELFRGHFITGTARDDALIDAGQSARRNLGVPADAWRSAGSWPDLISALEDAGTGAVTFVRIEQPGEVEHAIAFVFTPDRGIVLFDPNAPGKRHRLTTLTDSVGRNMLGPLADILPAPTPATRALLINHQRAVVRPGRTPADDDSDHKTVDALTIPGIPRVGSSRHPANQGSGWRGQGPYPTHPAGSSYQHSRSQPHPSAHSTPFGSSTMVPAAFNQTSQYPPPPSVPRRDTLIETARSLAGFLQWRGGAGTGPEFDWNAASTTNWGYADHFVRWVNSNGPEPGPQSVMSCYEAVFFAAYRAGSINKQFLKDVYAAAGSTARAVSRSHRQYDQQTGTYELIEVDDGYGRVGPAPAVAFLNAIFESVTRGPLLRYAISPSGIGQPDIPAGYLVFFDGIASHVALSLGTRDSYGRQQIFSLPGNGAWVDREGQRYGLSEITTVEETVQAKDYEVIEFSAPSWPIDVSEMIGQQSVAAPYVPTGGQASGSGQGYASYPPTHYSNASGGHSGVPPWQPSGFGQSYASYPYPPYGQSGPRGGARGDDPLAGRWPVGSEITVDTAVRGSADQRLRTPGDHRPDPLLEEVPFPGGGGKAAEAEYVFERPFSGADPGDGGASASHGAAAFSYTVTSSGRIVLPDGLELPADGWLRHGPDFVHRVAGVVLLGDSGWIGRISNWETWAEALKPQRLAEYQARVASAGLYLSPVRHDPAQQEGLSVHIGTLQAAPTPQKTAESLTTDTGFSPIAGEPLADDAAGSGASSREGTPGPTASQGVMAGVPGTGALTVTDDDGFQWAFSTYSGDDGFCVNVAVVHR